MLSRRMLYATTISSPSTMRSSVGAVVMRCLVMIRSSIQITPATAAMCGNSVSSWSVCSRYTGAVANTAVSARATMRPARRRTMPWNSTSHTHSAATSTSFRRS